MKQQPTRFSLLIAGLFPALAIVLTAHHFDSNPWVWSWVIIFEIMATMLLAFVFGQYIYGIAWVLYLRAAQAREMELITQLEDAEEREEQALQLAGMDPLTELPNRRGISLVLQKMFGAQRRFGHQDSDEDLQPKALQLAAAVIDLDGFKTANDQHGHRFGDAVLCLVAELLRRYFTRDTDIVCRSGGDEFQVFTLGEKDDVVIQAVASRLEVFCRVFEAEFQELFMSTYPMTQQSLSVTASCGVTIRHLPGDQDIDETLLIELLSSADQVMYQAKQQGKNQVVVALPPKVD